MPKLDAYGPPAIGFGSLRLWVHGRAHPEATDAWDSKWLRITAHCAESGGAVLITGVLLDTVSFFRWHGELTRVYRELCGKAVLESVEPNLRVVVEEARRHGQNGCARRNHPRAYGARALV
jgi:hypothetical protein